MNIFRNNSRVFSGKIGRKLLMALGSPYKNRWSPLCDATTDEEVFWAPCTRIVWCCFQINAKRRLKIVRAKSTSLLSEGFSRISRRVLGIFSFSIAAKCRRYQFSPRSVWSSTTGYYTCLSSWGHSFELAKVLMPERCLTTLETGVINASFKPTNALRVTKNTFCGLGRTPPKKSSKTF